MMTNDLVQEVVKLKWHKHMPRLILKPWRTLTPSSPPMNFQGRWIGTGARDPVPFRQPHLVHVGLRVILGISFDKGLDVWIYWHRPQRKEKKRTFGSLCRHTWEPIRLVIIELVYHIRLGKGYLSTGGAYKPQYQVRRKTVK